MLNLYLILDCSGSMNVAEKLACTTQATGLVKSMINEAQWGHETKLGVVAFSDEATWHCQDAFKSDDLGPIKAVPDGLTNLGCAIRLIDASLADPGEINDVNFVCFVLLSDGMPTDEYEADLSKLQSRTDGRHARMIIGIGDEVDHEFAMTFSTIPAGTLDYCENSEGLKKRLLTCVEWMGTNIVPALVTSTSTKKPDGFVTSLKTGQLEIW